MSFSTAFLHQYTANNIVSAVVLNLNLFFENVVKLMIAFTY